MVEAEPSDGDRGARPTDRAGPICHCLQDGGIGEQWFDQVSETFERTIVQMECSPRGNEFTPVRPLMVTGAPGNGTRTAGRPATANSAVVEAPDRQIARSAAT